MPFQCRCKTPDNTHQTPVRLPPRGHFTQFKPTGPISKALYQIWVLDKTLAQGDDHPERRGERGGTLAQDKGHTKVYRKQKDGTHRAKRWGLLLFKGTVLAGLSLAVVFLALVLFLPLPEAKVPQATRVYDIKGRLISSLFEQNRVVVSSSQISPVLKQAVVAVEDKRFFHHHGLDFTAIGRALVRNLKARRIVEGGSTITQQAARNLFLTLEVTPQRKFMEMVYTLKLEMRYTKDEILTMYLNQLYMGHGTWGMEVAAKTYFGKSVKNLSLGESALLAGIIKGPEFYSPYNDKEAGFRRRDLVLDQMVEQGFIDATGAASARAEDLVFPGLPQNSAPYFVNYAISQIRLRHPEIGAEVYRGGYEIYTSLDLDTQRAAEAAFRRYIPSGVPDSKGITQPQGALVAIDPETGYIKAMIGGRDWGESQLNRAFQAKRQPGSAFKIFLYAAVIDLGHPVTETRVCEPVVFPGASQGETYRPVDYGKRNYHYAPLTVRQAVAISDNVVAARWAQEITPDRIIEYAQKLGIQSPLQSNIPLALGASEVAPMEMAVAAATLSSGGIRPEPLAVLKLVDRKGQVLEDNLTKKTAVLSPGTSYVLTSVLRSVLAPGGTGSGLDKILEGRPAAAKSGTTDEELDAWFVGYTRELACSVYVGWDDREKSLGATGAQVAGPIWAHFMADALKNVPFSDWEVPPDAVWARVSANTGTLAWPGDPNTYYEVFLRRALPGPGTASPFATETLIPPEGMEVDPVPPIRAQEFTPPASPEPKEFWEPGYPPDQDFYDLLKRLFPASH